MVQITQEHQGDDEYGRSRGSETVGVCTRCKHKIEIGEGGGGCCGAMILGPLALFIPKQGDEDEKKR